MIGKKDQRRKRNELSILGERNRSSVLRFWKNGIDDRRDGRRDRLFFWKF